MPINTNIAKIQRVPEYETTLGSGFNRERRMVVDVFIKKSAWGLYLPDVYLTDDRLPALYSPYPNLPYPNTTTTTPATFSAFDADALLYDVNILQSNTLSSVRFEYIYRTVPPVIPGFLPQSLRRDPDQATPGNTDLGYDHTLEVEEIEDIYSHDGSSDPRCFADGVAEVVLQGYQVLNTAGDRYDKNPTRKLIVSVLNVSRLEDAYRPAFWRRFDYALNKTTWNGRAASTVLSSPPIMTGVQSYGANKLLYKMQYRFRWLNLDNIPTGMLPEYTQANFWRDVLLSYGTAELDEDMELVNIKDKHLQNVTTPQPLDSDGHAIRPPGSAPAAETVYRKFVHREFSQLNITLPDDESGPAEDLP